jgi:flagellar biosynthesis chaperone FliJ
MTAHEQDRGLTAVRRVRSARESDSRIGLQRALAEARARDEAAAQAAERISSVPAFGGGDARDFQLHRQLVNGLADHKRRAEESAAASHRVAEQARLHWLRDRTAVRTVDLLLERRAEVRGVERGRRETAQLDDLAASGWLRRTADLSGPRSAMTGHSADNSAAGEVS